MLTKSATPNASRRPAAERSEGAVPIRLADERREQVHARKGKSKIWRVRSNIQQAQVHARKEKARFGVCGATPNRRRYTPEKEKARFGVCGATPNRRRYTPERKKQDLACAEQHPTSSRNYLLYKQAEA